MNKNQLKDLTAVSDDVYFALEEEYGAVVPIEVADSSGRLVAELLFRRPEGKEIRFANKEIIRNEDLLAYADILINNTILTGGTVLAENNWIRLAVHDQVKLIITPLTARLGKQRVRGVEQRVVANKK